MSRLVAKFAGWGVVISLAGVAVTATPAATKGVRIRAAAEAVQQALQCEVRGEDARRQELLQSALEQVPDYPPALWQSGHVQHQNRWVRFDQLPDLLAEDSRLAEYQHRRDKTPNTVDGQLALARWCAEHKLDDRARAHLTAVLEIDPQHPQARQLLGFRKVDGVWLSQEEIQQAAIRAQQVEKGLAQWKPKLEEILQGLDHRSQRQRELAAKRLDAINDPAAAPAVELVLSMRDQQTALLAVGVLDRLSGPDAASALARQAVFSPWGPIRQAAVESLAKRDPIDYAPQLLSSMTTPVQTRAELYRAPNGRLTYRHALYREGQQHGALAVFETEYRNTVLWAGSAETYGFRQAALTVQRQVDAAQKAQAVETTVAQQNALIQRLNERLCWALSQATGENLPADPEAWWHWWNDYNGLFVAGAKPVQHNYSQSSVEFDDPYDELDVYDDGRAINYSYRGIPLGRRVYKMSCLIAGTRVWTQSGLKAIEEIRLGDLVLSQNPQTGELAYKPVLKTTVRPPTRMLKIVVGDKALQASGGHPFWIAGRGWVFARDLQEGSRLHAVDGTAEVRSVHPTGSEQLHNLVVADFHTYFVTEAKILTHDNTIREPTDALVPGLVEPSPKPATGDNDPSGLLTGLKRP